MRKIINNPDDFVDEVIDGILRAHPDQLRSASPDNRALVRRGAGRDGKVGIVTGGGSGHLPLFLGYVGEGLASGVAVGNVFSSPSPEQIYRATRASDSGRGVLYLYGNYGGDIYNFDLAAELARVDGVRTTTVRGADDVLSAPADKAATRRGVAGLFFAYKTAGAAAAAGGDLDEVTRIAQKTADAVLTMGVGLSPTVLPAAGEATFVLDDGEMEIGVGIHGEKGQYRGPIESADSITDRFMEQLIPGLGLAAGSRVAILVNGLGATPLEELYLVFRRAADVLAELDVVIERTYIGEFATSLEMAGASLSLLAVDDELLALLDAPAASPFYANGHVEAGADDVGVEDDQASIDAAVRPVRTVANPGKLKARAAQAVAGLGRHADELRALDAELGDGDLGITITAAAQAMGRRLEELPSDAAPSEIVRALGVGFSEGNPSTYAALIGGGLVSASSTVDDSAEFDRAQVATVVQALVTSVQQRGGAQRGDKTVVDVLWAITDYLNSPADSIGIDGVVAIAAATVEQTSQWKSVRGRAGWAGDRSIGIRDPGSVAILRTCQEIARSVRD